MNNTKSNNQLKISLGSSSFKKLLLESDVKVDKSLLIKSILETPAEVFLITRPRRWGKSINLDMLKTFFEIEVDSYGKPIDPIEGTNRKLFVGGEVNLEIEGKKTLLPLKIANCDDAMKHQGQYPIILLNFKDIKGNSYQEIEDSIRGKVITLFTKYPYLRQYLGENNDLLIESQKRKLSRYLSGEFSKTDLQESLLFLSEILYKHFRREVYVLIDEYDAVINDIYFKNTYLKLEPKELNDILDLFRTMLGAILKTNPCLKKGILTGILRVAKVNLLTDVNNVTEYNLLGDRFTEYYGFTQNEVDELITKVPTATDPQLIKDWYNGYNFGGQLVYNPWSIMCCLSEEGKLDSYWMDSGGTDLIDQVLLLDDVQPDLQALLRGQSISRKLDKKITLDQIQKNRDIFYSLLVFAGYLNPKKINSDPEDLWYELTIPNREVKQIYKDRMIQWAINKLKIDPSDYDNLIALFLEQKEKEFEGKLNQYLLNASSFFQTGRRAEVFYSGLMLGLASILTSVYIIESELESGKGKPDLVLIPKSEKAKDTAFIIEYKVCDKEDELNSTAEIGLQQIDNQLYDARVKKYSQIKPIAKVVKLSIAFCGKKAICKQKVESLD